MAINNVKEKTGGRLKGSVNKITKIGIKACDFIILKAFYEQVIGALKNEKYYVYSHEYNGNCFYIGKGKNGRAWASENWDRNNLWVEYVKQIGGKYDIKIIAADINEDEALSIESVLIKKRIPICNIRIDSN